MKNYIIIKQDGTKLTIEANKHRSINNTHYFATKDICDNIVYNVANITYSEIPPTTEELLEKAKSEIESKNQTIKSLQDQLHKTNEEFNDLRTRVKDREELLASYLRDLENCLRKTFTQKELIIKLIKTIQNGKVSTYSPYTDKSCISMPFITTICTHSEPKLGNPL